MSRHLYAMHDADTVGWAALVRSAGITAWAVMGLCPGFAISESIGG